MTAGRPRQFDYDQALEQAMRVFWAKGYEGTSMPDLTDAMGMNRPSIYAAFGNKEELFRKALERYADNAVALFRDWLSAPKLDDALEKFMMGAAAAYSCAENPKGCMAVQGALVCSDGANAARLEALGRREDVVNVLQERLDQALAEGELTKGTNTRELARFFTAVLQGMSVQSASGASCDEIKSIAKRALKTLS